MNNRWGQCIGLSVLIGVSGCLVGERNMAPGINDPYETTAIDEWEGRFEGESREVFVEREQIVALSGVESGMTVADVGAGSGLFTEMFAGKVGPTGKVYAADITPEFLNHIDKRVTDAGHGNVETVLCSDRSTNLPPNSVDVAFLCDTYHHLEYPGSSLASIRRALKPDGRLIVIDFDRIPGTSRDWILDHVRADRLTVAGEVMSMGFEVEKHLTLESGLKENYYLVFKKR